MTSVEETWSEEGVVLTFLPHSEGDTGARAVPASSLLPSARGVFNGGYLTIDMIRPDIATQVVFHDRRTAEEARGILLTPTETPRGVAATSTAAALGPVARASWWFQWCPRPVPLGVQLADVGISNWRAGLRRAALDALVDGGAAALGAWLRDIADDAPPERLVDAVIAAAREAVDALGTVRPEGRDLVNSLRLWEGVTDVPTDAAEFQDLWTVWDAVVASERDYALASSLGPANTQYAIGSVMDLVARDYPDADSAIANGLLVVASASVDWHAVPPRVLSSEEETISSLVDIRSDLLTIQVVAYEATETLIAGLVVQMTHIETGALAGSPMILRSPAELDVLTAQGPLPLEVRAEPSSFVPHVRHSAYAGPIRVGRAAAAGRAQRHLIRAYVAHRTEAARQWLGLASAPELQQQVRRSTNAAAFALHEAYPDGGAPPLSATPFTTPDSDSREVGLALLPAKEPLLTEIFLALAGNR